MEPIQYLWKDRKRFFGMPLSFTRYRLSDDRLPQLLGGKVFHVQEGQIL